MSVASSSLRDYQLHWMGAKIMAAKDNSHCHFIVDSSQQSKASDAA